MPNFCVQCCLAFWGTKKKRATPGSPKVNSATYGTVPRDEPGGDISTPVAPEGGKGKHTWPYGELKPDQVRTIIRWIREVMAASKAPIPDSAAAEIESVGDPTSQFLSEASSALLATSPRDSRVSMAGRSQGQVSDGNFANERGSDGHGSHGDGECGNLQEEVRDPLEK